MKKFIGKVVKTNNAKTAHVEIKSAWMHPKYLKKKTISHVFACQDLVGTHVGDEVEIIECRPISATKHFMVQTVTKAVAFDETKIVKKTQASNKKKSVKKKK